MKQPLLQLTAAQKVIGRIRQARPDILVVGFKTTTGATVKEQEEAGLKLLQDNGLGLVLANDTVERRNLLLEPGESHEPTMDRSVALRLLVDRVCALVQAPPPRV